MRNYIRNLFYRGKYEELYKEFVLSRKKPRLVWNLIFWNKSQFSFKFFSVLFIWIIYLFWRKTTSGSSLGICKDRTSSFRSVCIKSRQRGVECEPPHFFVRATFCTISRMSHHKTLVLKFFLNVKAYCPLIFFQKSDHVRA